MLRVCPATMKFRAVIVDQLCMRELFNIISTLSRMSKEICFNIQSDRIYLIGSESAVNGMPQIWSDIAQRAYFSEYQMEGIDKTDNLHILFTANTVELVSALTMLRGGAGVTYTKWKLTKKPFPCLSVDIEVPSAHASETRQISHDIPVKIIATRDWPEYALPKVPNVRFSLQMPSLRSIRGMVDKKKNLSSSLTVYLTAVGELSLVVETVMATISSQYSNLEMVKHDPSAAVVADDIEQQSSAPPTNVNGNGHEEISCRVDAKQLAVCLSSIQLQDMQMWCNVAQDRLFKMFIEVRQNVFINYVLWEREL